MILFRARSKVLPFDMVFAPFALTLNVWISLGGRRGATSKIEIVFMTCVI